MAWITRMDHPDASTHLLVCARHGASAARIVSACMPPNSSAKGMLYRACCTGHVVPLIMRHAAGQPVAHRGRFGVSTFRRFDGSLDGNLLRDVMMRCSDFTMQTPRTSPRCKLHHDGRLALVNLCCAHAAWMFSVDVQRGPCAVAAARTCRRSCTCSCTPDPQQSVQPLRVQPLAERFCCPHPQSWRKGTLREVLA